MHFTDALSRLVEYGRPYEGTDSFFCITCDELLRKNQVFVIDFYGLRNIEISFEDHDYKYTNNDLIRADFFKNHTWHYFTTWTDVRLWYNAVT